MLMDYTTAMKDVLCTSIEDTSEIWTHPTALEMEFYWETEAEDRPGFYKAASHPVRPATTDEDDGEVR